MPDVTIFLKPDGTVDLGRLAADIAADVVETVAAHVPADRQEAFYEILMTSIEARRHG